MTNRDRLIEALQGTAPNAVYREVICNNICCPYQYGTEEGFCEKDLEGYERNPKGMCLVCTEDWLSKELDYETQGVESGEKL